MTNSFLGYLFSQIRSGETNTTGHSSNFIFYIYLPSDKAEMLPGLSENKRLTKKTLGNDFLVI